MMEKRTYEPQEINYVSEILNGQTFVYDEWEDAILANQPIDDDIRKGWFQEECLTYDTSMFNAYPNYLLVNNKEMY